MAPDLGGLLLRLVTAVERLAPPITAETDLDAADAFVWEAQTHQLRPVAQVFGVPLELLVGIDRVRDILLANTERFAAGRPANNALLWGARGMGKSSLIKAIHGRINDARPHALALIEIHREDIDSLPRLLQRLARSGRRCLLFCDDLSFDLGDTTYKSLKAVLEGGIDGLPRDMIENERSTAIHPGEAIEEKVSLSDRFGLWLGFHPCSQDDYLAMVDGYVRHFALEIEPQTLRREALEWAQTRGARSGRVAWQYVQDLAGRRDS
jgi:predicted AAA+ superfamily ATPase